MGKKKLDLSEAIPAPEAKADYIRKGAGFKKDENKKMKLCGYYLELKTIAELKELEKKLRRKASSIMQEALEDILIKYSNRQ